MSHHQNYTLSVPRQRVCPVIRPQGLKRKNLHIIECWNLRFFFTEGKPKLAQIRGGNDILTILFITPLVIILGEAVELLLIDQFCDDVLQLEAIHNYNYKL